ncbi:MAG: MotA/TolQ/ExbB proton channel family protein [Bacteroidota bacterium]
MENKNQKSKGLGSIFSAIVIPAALIVSFIIYYKVLGNGSHFQGGNPENNPLPGDYFGVVYKGGFIVPVLMSLLLIVITFSIERFFTISKAKGKGSAVAFVRNIRALLQTNNINEAMAECEKQKGSIGNVVNSVLIKYKQVETETEMSKDQKLVALQKEVEESTALELPALEQNLGVLATISSVATLMGLLGTVLGMIRAFAALANAGSPDSVALANGISEALINTALGIGTAALAIIAYNFFTTRIDKLTYSIDEAGFTIVQSYGANHK